MLCLATLPLSYSNAQVNQLDPTQIYTTGNIVQQTIKGSNTTPWVNGVYQDNLTCWAGGNPGYCGPNAIVRPGNNINFSYGLTDLHQVQAVASALPNSGTGLLVKGFNFSFTAKNGNGWDDARQDYLVAYVNFYKANGSLAEAYDYSAQTNRKYDWSTFNFSETFASSYAAQDLSNVRYGFIGRDNNYWAGPYGPEVYGVSFNLKYSVDPCFVNVLSSPSCPGYLQELAKLNTNTTPLAESNPAQQAQSIEVPITTSMVSSTTVPQTTQLTVQNTSITVSAPQSTKPTSVSTSKILSIVNSVQAQVANVERAVVQQSQQDSQKASAQQTQDQLDQTLGSQQQAQTQEQVVTIQQQNNFQATTTKQNFSNNTQSVISVLQPVNNQTNITSFSAQPVNNNFSFQPKIIEIATAAQSATTQNFTYQPLVPQQPVQQEITQIIVQKPLIAAPKIEPVVVATVEQKELISPTNPLQQFVENKLPLDNVNQTQPTKQVNQKVQDSELATGISIATIAKQPQGFESYTLVLQDVQFYKSTEVYKNQRTVDNQRAIRALTGASDIRHQELVDLQYRR